jgi:hypothetical protein
VIELTCALLAIEIAQASILDALFEMPHEIVFRAALLLAQADELSTLCDIGAATVKLRTRLAVL